MNSLYVILIFIYGSFHILTYHKDNPICEGIKENQTQNMLVSTTKPQTLMNHSLHMHPQHNVMNAINANSSENTNTNLSGMNINSVMLPRDSNSLTLSELPQENRSVNHIESQTTRSGR